MQHTTDLDGPFTSSATVNKPQASRLRLRLIVAAGGPLVLLFVAVGVAIRGLSVVTQTAKAGSDLDQRSSSATQSVLLGSMRTQLAGMRLLETQAPVDAARFEAVSDDADRVRREATREGSLSSGERSALARIGRFQRNFETRVARIRMLQYLGRDTAAQREMTSLVQVDDSVQAAMSDFRRTSDVARASRQQATMADAERTTFLVLTICLLAAIAAVLSLAAMLTRLATTLRTEAQLTLAKEAAEETSRLKSDFLAMMSHEIRTPMNGVLGTLGIALDTKMTAEQRSYLTMAQSSAEALLVILNDILDFSKIEAGKLEIESAPFDLHGLLEDVSELLAPRAHDKDLELVVRVPPGLPARVIGDSGRLRQVLINLIGNAIKFTAKGHIFIEVTATEVVDNRTTMRFVVRDTGIGISPEQQSRLFQKFAQADVSTTRRFGGTGLGLAISRQLVELMGGSVEVTSKVGEGSTFALTLPFALEQSEPPAIPEPGELRGVRVLVVDDSAMNRMVLKEQVTAWGMVADEAEDAFVALKMLRSSAIEGRPYPVAIVDFLMPGRDGEALARDIRTDSRIAKTTLVLLTSSMLGGDLERVARAGFNACFVKPVRPSVLRDALAVLRGAFAGGLTQPLLTRHTLHDLRHRRRALTPVGIPIQTGAPRRVLVVEDNAVNQIVARKLLERAGCEVVIANDGTVALKLHETQRFDAIFMDCHLPEMDGFEATIRIREAERASGAHIPIIAMTATAMQGDRERCVAAGMDDYVSKPVVPSQLFEVLDKWTAPREPRSPGPSQVTRSS
jgi:signal transduction histidine kinase/CheY-like chemotaxis protein